MLSATHSRLIAAASALLLAAPAAAFADTSESAKLCTSRAVCSFVVSYPTVRLMFIDGARPAAKNGYICNSGWRDPDKAKAGAKAEFTTETQAGVWSEHWTALAPGQCRSFHGILNLRLRAGTPQSAWQAIYTKLLR